MHGILLATLAIIVCLVLGACGSRANHTTQMEHEAAQGPYKPGMGDLMSTLQLRHAKLWYAGQAQNWELVDFELHEIDETFEQLVRWHPRKDNVPIAPLLAAYTQIARAALAQSAEKQDLVAFETNFDQLTRDCNGCHQTMKHGFIVIQRPSAAPVSNQGWELITAE